MAMMPLKLLCILYGLAAGVMLVWWLPWLKLTRALVLHRYLERLLPAIYALLALSLLLAALVSAHFWHLDMTTMAQLRLACRVEYALAVALVIQVAAFGLIYTPVILKRKSMARGFLKTLVKVECLLVPITVMSMLYFVGALRDSEIMMLQEMKPVTPGRQQQ
jgi:hypothetical protein